MPAGFEKSVRVAAYLNLHGASSRKHVPSRVQQDENKETKQLSLHPAAANSRRRRGSCYDSRVDCFAARPTDEELTTLVCAADQRPAEIALRAARIRDENYAHRITFSPKVFIPITNLCRNACAYCSFRRAPREEGSQTLRPADVARLLDAGARAGCTEALFCLGDRPEAAFPTYREQLARLGYASTVDYLAHAAELALERGLLPHTNAGVLTGTELRRLKQVNASLGLMLEQASLRLCLPGQPHHRSPDKYPAGRLAMIADAGALQIPFTTGILVGIGETREERIGSLLAIRALHQQYGHIQEVIVQPFRAHSRSAMAMAREPDLAEVVLTVALARIILPPEVSIQVPPNLGTTRRSQDTAQSDGLDDLRSCLGAGINDIGGISPVTPDHINPGFAWPAMGPLQSAIFEAGFRLEARLPIYERFVHRNGFVAPKVRQAIASTHRARQPAYEERTQTDG